MSYALLSRRVEAAPASKARVPASDLRIGEPNDSFEQEADRVANQIVTNEGARRQWSLSTIGIGAPLQRKCACSSAGGTGECEDCGQEKMLQRKSTASAEQGFAPPIVNEVLSSSGQPLGQTIRDFFEPRFGFSFGAVRVHSDAQAAQSARSINARAYTVGYDIVLDGGQLDLRSAAGMHLLAHELTHVAQQRGDPIGQRAALSSPEGSHGSGETATANNTPDGRRRESEIANGSAVIRRQSPNNQQIKEGAKDIQRLGALGLLAAEPIWRSKALAEKLAFESHLDGSINGPADAFRHCVLSCLLTACTDRRTATVVTETHEQEVPNKPNETKMDLHNNEIGISCGGESDRRAEPFWKRIPIPKRELQLMYHNPTKEEADRCVSCTWNKLSSGLLWVIPDWAKGGAAVGEPMPEKWGKPVEGKSQIPTVNPEDLPKAPIPTVTPDDLPKISN